MNREAIKAYNEAIIKQLRAQIGKILADNKMSYDYDINPQGTIEITVEDGDWKHDHLRLKTIMAKNGFFHFGRDMKGEDPGDDSYSAIHYFR